MKPPIAILMVDDHPLIAEGLRSLIREREDMFIAGTAATASETLEMVRKIPAEVLLLDINLPDGSGIDLCREIRGIRPNLRILGLSNFSERSMILRMFNNGAYGYILKSSPVEELVKAIRIVASGGIYFGEGIQQIIANLAGDGLMDLPPLTRREKEVLQYLAQGFTSPQIGEKMFISPVTVDSHRRSLMQKFGVSNTVSLLNKAKEVGMV